MKKNKFYIIVLSLSIILSISNFSAYATDSNDNEIQPYMPVQDYDDDFLEAYQETVAFMEENSMFVDVSLETFEDEYNQSAYNNIEQFKEAKIAELESNPPETPTNVTVQNAGANSRENGSGSDYFYDIGDTLSFQPNYDNYYIYETAQKGDFIYEPHAAGELGHTAIVEGHFYSTQYGYYIRTIEATDDYDVCYGLFDAPRATSREISLYRVDDATAYQKAMAVQFCKNQIGEEYGLLESISNNWEDSNDKWICSQLVWAGYKNQGIDIESTSDRLDLVVMPEDITVDSVYVSEVNFKTRQTAVSGKFKNSLSDTAVFVDEGDNDTSLQVRYGNRDVCDQEWLSAVNGFVYSRIVDVVAGDFNGDGYDDIMVIYNYNSSTTSMYLWVGSSSGLSYSCKPWEGTSFPSSGILDVVVGDFYGDTKEDIAIVYQHAGSTTSIFLWRGTSTLPVLTGIHSNGSIWTSTTFSGVNIRQIVSGRFSSTTKSDLVLLYDYGGTTTGLFEWKGATSSFILINNYSGGSVWRSESFNPNYVVELVVGNFTGTSYDDLTIIYDYRNEATAFFEWKGTSAGLTKVPSTVWNFSQFEASRMTSRITSGDYNGDGYCDVAGFYDLGDADTKLFYWKGSSSGFTTANSSGSWYSGTFDATCISGDVVSGNHNNSAYDDINVVFSTDNIWLFEWRGSSSGLYFNSTIGTGILMW